MRYVLDACALLAFIRNEDGALTVRQALESEHNVCLVHSVNLCEVYYDCLRCYGNDPTEKLLAGFIDGGLKIRDDMDSDFWKAAGKLKARGRISLADCFAIALSVREDAVLLTSPRFGSNAPLLPVPVKRISRHCREFHGRLGLYPNDFIRDDNLIAQRIELIRINVDIVCGKRQPCVN